MKKALVGIIMLTASSNVFAVAAGGNGGCGWGNALFAGQNGVATHVLAGITNAFSGNNTFGMTTGTNGCETSGSLSYGGQSVVSSMLDEFSEDAARGEGDALDTVAVLYGVEKQDRETFAKVIHDNYAVIFTSEDVTTEEVIASVEDVMRADPVLSKYIVA